MESKRQKDNQQLRKWIKQSGCLIHPAIEIPAYFQGIQGIGTRQYLPHKTVIIAIPSKLVITVPRCYNDPQLKSLFKSCDDLFDYESDEDAQFNILCVFLMYHKLHIQRSPWSVYLKTIAEPQTGVSWPDKDLAGLNKSVIQQILHVRKQCKKVQDKLCTFLAKTKQFKHLKYQQIVNLFRICYPTVLTRCFGYYFSTACMIPVADLMNHGCETIDHQLIHINLQRGVEFDQTYNNKKNKLDCQIMGLQRGKQLKMPFRLQYLLSNNLIQNKIQQLANIRRKQIDNRINNYLSKKLEKEDCQLQTLDFCQQADQQDNDTDEEEQYGQTKTLQYIKAAQKQQMVQFQKHYLKVQKLADVQKKIMQKYGDSDEDTQTNISNNKQKVNQNKSEQVFKEKEQTKGQIQEQSFKVSKNQQIKSQQKSKIQNLQSKLNTINTKLIDNKICPVQFKDSSSQESGSEQQQWCLDQTCYFTMSTHTPVNAGAQLFNSYGSRTNKFLLVWYGFTYPNNLYDSVTLRIQANFPLTRPKPKNIVLDTYVGGQGLCFKKNQQQQVRPQEVSKQFRLKRSRLPLQFLMFLRLFLVNYYQGCDNYKVLCTFPSSLQFQLELLEYFKQIVQCLYERYPLKIIQVLKQQLSQEEDKGRRSRINFKIIYLEQQRKILDSNIQAVEGAIQAIKRLKKSKEFNKNIYKNLKISTIRMIKQYLVQVKNNMSYILYSQETCIKLNEEQINRKEKQ